MQLRVHPAAQRELGEAVEWSQARHGRRVAARLQQRFEQVGEILRREPELGTAASGQARNFPLGQFPYTLVYRIEGPVIHVLALMHQSRMPDYWIGR